jgi:hypothetical protein
MSDASEAQLRTEPTEEDVLGGVGNITFAASADAGGAVGETNEVDDDGRPEEDLKSALADNIARKGSNAYYFAHAHKANGPKWDGKAEPKLLKKHSIDGSPQSLIKAPSFLYHKSNITSYAFLDEDKAVKLYINMEEVGEKCTEEDVILDWDRSSLSLVVKNFKETDQCLSFGKLTGTITDAKYKLKKDKIILTLQKEKEGVEWHTINDKGAPDHDLV